MKHLFFVLALTIVASLGAFGQCSEADRKKLEEFDRAWGDASRRGDRDYLASVYADEFASLSLYGMQTKAQTIEAAVKQAEKERNNPNPDKIAHDFYKISCTGNTATITHRNVVTSMEGGKEQTWYSRSVHFLEKRGGNWQVVSSTGHMLDDEAALMYIEQEWNDADIKGDVAWFERMYADDATDISSRTGAIGGKKETIADMKTRKSTMEWAELSQLNARVEGSFAVVTGINHVKGHDDKGAAYDRSASFTDTYIKRNGRWLVWATQGTELKK